MTVTVARERRQKNSQAGSLSETVAVLCRRHSRSAVRAALLQYWLAANRISSRRFDGRTATGRFLESAPVGKSEKLLRQFESSGAGATLKDLEGAFESLIDAGRRRRQGAVYTPDFVIDYLLQTALDRLKHNLDVPTVCDPACGSGGFLVRAAQHLSERHDITAAEALRKYVVGFDVDAKAIEHARCLLELFLIGRGERIPRDGFLLFRQDTLLARPEALCELAGAEDGFDVVAMNPPYVKLQNLPPSYREKLLRQYRSFAKGSFSLAPLFLLAGNRLLSSRGNLACITQNNLFTSLSGEPIRQYLQERRAVWRIVDFGHQHIFDNASAYTCLMFLDASRRTKLEYECLQSVPNEQRLSLAKFSKIPWNQLQADKWRLAKGRHLENLHRIESVGTPLGEVAKIQVGFATLKDRVFLVKEIDGRTIAIDHRGKEVEIERELTRAAIKVASVGDQSELADVDLRVIFPYRHVDGQFQLIEERELRQYKRTFRYLAGFRDVLDARDKGKKKSEAWYAWGRSQGRQASGPKLLTKTFDRRPHFMLDRSDRLFCNGYGISLREPTATVSIELLQRILNSRVMHYYARLTSFQIEGGYQCYQKNFIERFTVPRFTAQQLQRMALLDDDKFDARLAKLYGIAIADLDDILVEKI